MMTIGALTSVAYVKSYFREIFFAMILAITGALLVAYDRRPPLVFISTEITPSVVVPGQSITVHRHVEWRRQCEGTAYTEIVSYADRIVTPYDPGSRYPYDLGDTYADRSLSLPLSMRAGKAAYRGIIKFKSCGVTSRLVPLEIPYQEQTFEVR